MQYQSLRKISRDATFFLTQNRGFGRPENPSRDLYADPSVYEPLFPLDANELAFWKGVVGASHGKLLDLGAGPSSLGSQLGFAFPIALDACHNLLAAGPSRTRLQADARFVPLRRHSIRAIISRLFGIGYAAAVSPEKSIAQIALQIKDILIPGGIVALEIPLAWQPHRLQGIEESAEVSPNHRYRFRYLELLQAHEFGATLESEITLTNGSSHWRLAAPLFVFTPDGAARWAASAGLSDVQFYASYHLDTATTRPPEDVLRGVLVARA